MNDFLQKPEVIVSILAAVISLLGLATTIWIFHHNGKQNRNAIKLVMEDLLRHFKANLAVYDMIELDKGKPSSVYFSKCKIDETCLVFNVDTYKSIKPAYLPMFNRLRLNYRNGNLEMDAICEYLKKCCGEYSVAVMEQYIWIARERQMKLHEKTSEFLLEHYGSYNEIPPGKLQDIVYEEPFTSEAPELK